MPSLPQQGGSDGTWGDELNDFLSVCLDSGGDSSALVYEGDVLTYENEILTWYDSQYS